MFNNNREGMDMPKECHCNECGRDVDNVSWVNDRYGIPYKLVCDDCYDNVQARISGYQFDAADCGECLEDDY